MELSNELAKIFEKKNRHYNDDYFSGNYEELERWMSIKRKISRLEAYYKNKIKSELPEETIEDTWRDLAIYCIMELMIMKMEKNDIKI